MHPRLNIDDDAIEFLEVLVYQLLSQICSSLPHSVSDVEEHVQATFAYPIDQWSLNEAHEKLERHAARKRNVFLFPIDKIHHQLMKVIDTIALLLLFLFLTVALMNIHHRMYLDTRLM